MGDVIDIFSRKIIQENTHVDSSLTNQDTNQQCAKNNFDKLSIRNKANQERLRREREQANKNVMRSYRIK